MLADLANVSRPTLHSIIQGDAKGIQFEKLDKLSRFLEMERKAIVIESGFRSSF